MALAYDVDPLMTVSLYLFLHCSLPGHISLNSIQLIQTSLSRKYQATSIFTTALLMSLSLKNSLQR